MDVASISAVVAAIGVIIGVVFAVLQLRNLVKTRQSDLLMKLYSTWGSEDLQKAVTQVMALEFKDYEDYVKRYGLWTSGRPAHIALFRVDWFFNGIGVLLDAKLADIRLVDKLFGYMVIPIWEKMKPTVEGWRRQLNMPKSLEWFEYLHNEMQRRQQKLQQTQQ